MEAQHDPKKAAQLLKDPKITNKQRRALSALVPTASSALVTAALGSSKSKTVVSDKLGAMVRSAVREAIGEPDPLADPQYNELYAHLGCPTWMPHPRPFFTGNNMHLRYGFTRGYTGTISYSLAAGGTALIWAMPLEHGGGRSILRISSAGPAGTLDFSRYGLTLAYPSGGYTSYADAPWAVVDPHEAFRDPGSVSTAGFNALVSATDNHPPLTQILGGVIEVQVTSEYNGSGIVYNLAEDSRPEIIGRMQHPSMFDVASNIPSGVGLQSNLIGKTCTIFNGGTHTVASLFEMHATATTMCGNSRRVIRVPVLPSTSWCYSGTLNATDCVPGAATCVLNNMHPRDSIPFAIANYGAVLVKNTGTGPLLIAARSSFSFATLLEQMNGVASVSSLASMLRQSAPVLVDHKPAVIGSKMPPLVGNSEAEVHQALVSRGAQLGASGKVLSNVQPGVESVSHAAVGHKPSIGDRFIDWGREALKIGEGISGFVAGARDIYSAFRTGQAPNAVTAPVIQLRADNNTYGRMTITEA